MSCYTGRQSSRKKNEVELLRQKLIDKNIVLDVTNRELLASQDELQLLNRSLELKSRNVRISSRRALNWRSGLFHQTVNALDARPGKKGHLHCRPSAAGGRPCLRHSARDGIR